MARNIIQINTTATVVGRLRREVVTVITALCDDGSVWWRIKGDGKPSEWSRVDDVPSEE